MSVLVAAVAGLGALSLFELALILGIVRRLKIQDEQLAQLTGPGAGAPTVDIGRRVGDFEALATDGAALRRESTGLRAIAFFTPDCKACTQQLPQFVGFAAKFGGEAVAVVVADDEAQRWAYNEKLAGVARVVLEPTGGGVATAFAVSSFPALAVTDADGVVLASGNAMRDLAALGEAVGV